MPTSIRRYQSLVKRARLAQRHSHAPFSRFHVGAALLAASGKVFEGCNVENSSYGLTICAERTALFKAISEGARKFRAIAVVSDEDGFTSPCGACRQVILDLAGDIDVIMADRRGRMKILKMNELLPHPFTPDNLLKVSKKKSR
jgi:cytidine deaminase